MTSVKLFSDNGIDSNHSRHEPNCIYYPDNATINVIHYFFETLLSSQTSTTKENHINTENFKFLSDISYFISNQSEKLLSVDDVILGMCHIASHFISKQDLIQLRCNAYIRSKLVSAELILNGMVQSQSDDSIEKDQILLNSVTVPTTPRDEEHVKLTPRINTTHNNTSNNNMNNNLDGCTSNQTLQLFHSNSVLLENLHSSALVLFTLHDETLRVIDSFLLDVFAEKGFISKLDIYDKDRLSELWQYFDLDNDGIVTCNDINRGCINIGLNFIATDDFIQVLINSYIQRKIRRALYLLSNSQTSFYAINVFNDGDNAIFVDEEGNPHQARVIRKSHLMSYGNIVPAYYIETEGVQLFVSSRKLQSQQTMVNNKELKQSPLNKEKLQHCDYKLISELSQKIEIDNTNDINTINIYIESKQHHHDHHKSVVSNGVIGISSVLHNNNNTTTTLLDNTTTMVTSTTIPTTEVKTITLTNHSYIDHDTDNNLTTQQPQPIVVIDEAAAIVMNDSNNTNQTTIDIVQQLPSVSSSRLEQGIHMIFVDSEILNEIILSIGKSYLLKELMIPNPKKIEQYPIFFNRGKSGFFEFNQIDYGVSYLPFLKNTLLINSSSSSTIDKSSILKSQSAIETNRCFYLHFGVAMGIHPYSIQQCFRKAAVELLKQPDIEMTIFFGEALESLLLRSDFVDAQVLNAIWPIEFDSYKILIIRVDNTGKIESFTSFRSENGPIDEFGEWHGKEIIFTLQWNHFTILKPKSDQLKNPITALLCAANTIGILPLEFITKVSIDQTQRYRICT